MTFVKLFGLQRSGTNLVKGLLEVNFRDVRVLQNILGNKHERFDRVSALNWQSSELPDRYRTMRNVEIDDARSSLLDQTLCAVLSIKNPYSWLVSYSRLRNEKNPNREHWGDGFLKRHTKVWIDSNHSWLCDLSKEFDDRLVVNFYDQTVLNTISFLELIERIFSLSRSGELVDSFPRATLRGNDSHFGESLMGKAVFDKAYYTDKRYRQCFSKRQRRIVDSILSAAPDTVQPYAIW